MTQSGHTCQPWSSQCPHRHHRTPNKFPELENAGGACRNPGGQAPLGPWCYTTNPSVRWEYCNVPVCSPGKFPWKQTRWETEKMLNTPIYYINTNEIPSLLSRENLISSYVKITCYLHMWKYHHCYGFIINRAFHTKKLLKWNGLVFHWCLYNK